MCPCHGNFSRLPKHELNLASVTHGCRVLLCKKNISFDIFDERDTFGFVLQVFHTRAKGCYSHRVQGGLQFPFLSLHTQLCAATAAARVRVLLPQARPGLFLCQQKASLPYIAEDENSLTQMQKSQIVMAGRSFRQKHHKPCADFTGKEKESFLRQHTKVPLGLRNGLSGKGP